MSISQWQSFINDNPTSQTGANLSLIDLAGHYSVLAITGPDSTKFLQGQVTCDLNKLTASSSQLGARCNNKGRIEFSFRVLKPEVAPDEMWCVIPTRLIQPAESTLAKYIVFSKAELSVKEHIVFGIIAKDRATQSGSPANPLPPTVDEVICADGAMILKHTEQQWLVIAPIESAKTLWCQFASKAGPANLNDWHLASIASGRAEVLPGGEDEFIPQMLNYDLLSGGVSFTKGCYLGQEIVARMQYRGKMKRHLRRLSGESEQLPQPGQDLFATDSNKSIGNIVVAASINSKEARPPHRFEALAVVTDDAAEENCINLTGNSPLNLQLLPLPYAITY